MDALEWARPVEPLAPRPKPTRAFSSSYRKKSRAEWAAGSDHDIVAQCSTPVDEKVKARKSRYIADESQLELAEPTPPHLAEMNNGLALLCDMFPDIQVEVFREMMSEFSDESRLALIADLLLKNPTRFIRGRRKSLGDDNGEAAHMPGASRLLPKEEFHDDDYKAAVQKLAAQEFPSLAKSTIRGVLSEFNHSYLDARDELALIVKGTWKAAFKSTSLAFLYYFRKPVPEKEAINHPLIAWRPGSNGIKIPTIKSTENARLDRELFHSLVAPILKEDQHKLEADDRAYAIEVHTKEAEDSNAMYECACCYGDSTFEEFTTCSTDGHMVCFSCVQGTLKESLYGQGWQRSINVEKGYLYCPAVSAEVCSGHITSDDIFRAVSLQTNGTQIMRTLDQRLANHGLLASGLSLIHCPFCDYAEADDIYMPPEIAHPKLRRSALEKGIVLAGLGMFFSAMLLPERFVTAVLSFLTVLLATLMYLRSWPYTALRQQIEAAYTRFLRRRRTLKFRCQNPECSRESCLTCSKAWNDPHICFESGVTALRLSVEQAMALAIKRVCPKCNTSFVKERGCNKMKCTCGYEMCYICRLNINGTGYQHFCQHFRQEGDGTPCKECDKCNLWQKDDDEELIRQAKAEAERKFLKTHNRELTDAEKAYLGNRIGEGDSTQADAPTGHKSKRQAKAGSVVTRILRSTEVNALFPGIGEVQNFPGFLDFIMDQTLV